MFKLTPPQVVYLLFFAALSALSPYLPLFYKQAGLDGTEIGILIGLPALIMLLSAPLWGAIADVARRARALLVLSILGSTIPIVLMIQEEEFLHLLPYVIAFSFFHAPLIPLIDSATLAWLSDMNRYGRQRVWGTVGWGVMSPIIGWLSDWRGVASALYAYAVLQGATLIASLRLPQPTGKLSLPFLVGLRSIATNRRWGLFLLSAFVGGTGLSVVDHFYFLHLESLGFDRRFMGISMVLSTASELPIMLASTWFLRRISASGLLSIAIAVLGFRMLGYAWTESPTMILLIQLTHGVTFGFLWIGGVTRAHELAPEGMGATAQSLFAALAMGVGRAVGAAIGGGILDAEGTVFLYRQAGIAMMVALVLVLALERFWGDRGGKEA